MWGANQVLNRSSGSLVFKNFFFYHFENAKDFLHGNILQFFLLIKITKACSDTLFVEEDRIPSIFLKAVFLKFDMFHS